MNDMRGARERRVKGRERREEKEEKRGKIYAKCKELLAFSQPKFQPFFVILLMCVGRDIDVIDVSNAADAKQVVQR